MIANSLIRAMEGHAFEVVQVRANITDISRMEEVPWIWILYLQGEEGRFTELLSYIRDQIKERGYRLFVIGTPEELEENAQVYGRTGICS